MVKLTEHLDVPAGCFEEERLLKAGEMEPPQQNISGGNTQAKGKLCSPIA